MRAVIARVLAVFRRERHDETLDEEVRTHLDLLAADYERRGMSPDEARFAARRAFGAVEPMKERHRDLRGWPVLTTLGQDLRFAARTLARSRSFAIPVVLSLAFAVGINVAAFTVLNALVFRPLPVHEPNRLFHITYVDQVRSSEGGNYSWFEYVGDRARSVSAVFIAHRRGNMKVTVEGAVEVVSGLQASGGYFEGLGVAPQRGRVMTADDERGSAPVAVLSDEYWTRRFGRDPGVVGRTIRVDGRPHVVIGVTPPEFFGVEVGRRVDVTVPIDASEYRQGWVTMALLVRLADRVSSDSAADELTALLGEFARSSGGGLRDRLLAQRVHLAPLASGVATDGTVRDRLTQPVAIATVLIGLMLLLASSNWAMLLLARAAARRREVAVRLALGSTRVRVARQMVAESVLLAALAALIGFLGASWAVHYLPGNGLPPDLRLESDLRVFAFALAMSALIAVLFSAAPVWLSRRISADDLRTAGRMQDRRVTRAGRLLVIAQVAVSVVVLVAAALFGATLRNLRGLDMGFSAEGVITFSLDAEGTGLEGAPLRALHGRVLERLNAIEGVESATLATIAPLSGTVDGKRLVIPGFVPRGEDDLFANLNTVGPDYFETFGIPILRGRGIATDDAESSPQVALVSKNAADYYFAGRDPIGSRIEIRGRTISTPEIIGIVPDVMYGGLRGGRDRMVYVPFAQRPAEGEYAFAVRTTERREPFVIREIPRAVGAIAPDLPVLGLSTMTRHIDGRTANERLLATTSASMGALALLLAGIGIYGIVAYTVTRRTAELGVRMALGARGREVLWHVARGSMAVIAAGIVIGVALAMAASTLLAGVLFGVPASDPRAYAAAAAALLITGLAAVIPPALRAVRIHPAVAIRYD